MTYDERIAHDALRPLQEIRPMAIDRSISYAALFGQAERSLRFMGIGHASGRGSGVDHP